MINKQAVRIIENFTAPPSTTFLYHSMFYIMWLEKASWTLAPNMFSAWGKVEVPADTVMTVETVKLDGADGKAFLNADAFSDRDEARFKKLSEQYGVN